MSTKNAQRLIDRLLAQLGIMLGIDGLVLDEDNTCILEIDEVEVLMCWDAEVDRLLFDAVLGAPDSEFDQLLLETLLTANYLRLDLGGAVIGINPDRQQFTLSQRLDIQAMDEHGLAMLLSEFSDHAVAWRARIAQAVTTHKSPVNLTENTIPAGHLRV